VDTQQPFIVSLPSALHYPKELIGNKAYNLSICLNNGYRVPSGFCISAAAYQDFIRINGLKQYIDLELYRKDLKEMRWEEIWDTALRIRSLFLKGTLPPVLIEEINNTLAKWPVKSKFALRSSSAAEDSSAASFAGIHESYLNIAATECLETVKLVWASLWSDRSLLYREEKKLDSRKSAMPVLIQAMENAMISGLAFSVDPAGGRKDLIIIELISGSLDLLVDNIKEPERIMLAKNSGAIISDGRSAQTSATVTNSIIQKLYENIIGLEKLFGQPVDIEWTGLGDSFTVLQVRPITGFDLKPAEDERTWYLTLTPGKKALIELSEKVEQELIPKLMAEVDQFSKEETFPQKKEQFIERFRARGNSYQRWKKTYRDDFIPFAHGIRNFGTYYNDLIKPDDPYEFVSLLASDNLLALERNKEFFRLAALVNENDSLKAKILAYITGPKEQTTAEMLTNLEQSESAGAAFATGFKKMIAEQMNVYYNQVGLADDQDALLKTVLALSEKKPESANRESNLDKIQKLEADYLQKAGPVKKHEASNWLRIGRLSWKLRDDDNILLGKLEHELYSYAKEALNRLQKASLLSAIPEKINLEDWSAILESLQSGLELKTLDYQEAAAGEKRAALKPRQLIGQPSSVGIATARARVIHSVADFKAVAGGEILVFDAVQPQMTFIISLAAGIIERRGGMLVHSSIIARELGIPAVNGVSRATELIETGDLVTVNGDLGLVVIGEPEFDLENA
jgi:phosphoenolpyruvate synthase/pyruvate phosphate dikinase